MPLVFTADVQIGELPDVGDLDQRLKRGMARAVQAIAKHARANLEGPLVRVRTGRLRGSLRTRVWQEGRELFGRVWTANFVGRLLETGTKGPYIIRPRRGHALVLRVGGRTIEVSHVTHPGLAPRPWFSTAVEEAMPEVHAAFADELDRSRGESSPESGRG